MTTYGTSPDARRALLREHGIVRHDDDAFYRSHPNVARPGHYGATPSDVERVANSLAEADPRSTWVSEIVDTAESDRQGRLIYSRHVINSCCPFCGGPAVRPPTTRNGQFICDECWVDQRQGRAAEEAEAGLAWRDAQGFLAEVGELYDDRLRGNPLTRPTFRRIAQR